MRISGIKSWSKHFRLSRPYTIAFKTTDSVDNFVLKIETDTGCFGIGSASPEPFVTGETKEDCKAALDEASIEWLVGKEVNTIPGLHRIVSEMMGKTPAARAAVDIALHDLYAKSIGVPLVDLFGRCHNRMQTSITIGIKSKAATIEEAREYVDRKFNILKVKCGHCLEEDIERLQALRKNFGKRIKIRVDPNQGYTTGELIEFINKTSDLDIEFLEQPVKTDAFSEIQSMPEEIKNQIAADESLLNEMDALRLASHPKTCNIFNIKLMKCGGIFAARRISVIAETAGIKLMWGCMDESAISIAAALHAAFASPGTKYLDLDGSFDLEQDIVSGGFILKNGFLYTTELPGLGVSLLDEALG